MPSSGKHHPDHAGKHHPAMDGKLRAAIDNYDVWEWGIGGNRLFDHNISENLITFEQYYVDEKFKYVVGSNYIEKVVDGWAGYKFMKISDVVASPDVLRIVSSEK